MLTVTRSPTRTGSTYLVPRGSLGRGPSEWEASVQAQYPLRFGEKRVNLVMDIFNLFDRQKAIQLDERYNLALHGRCSEGNSGLPPDQCNGDNGWLTRPDTLIPVGSLVDPRANAPNRDFLQKGAATTTAFRSTQHPPRRSVPVVTATA